MKDWWDRLSKETAAYVLGGTILLAWLLTIFMHYPEASTLTNVVMIIVGYIWGSSSGSKSKDPTNAPGAVVVAAKTTTTETTTNHPEGHAAVVSESSNPYMTQTPKT
jgi:hypothetical protein